MAEKRIRDMSRSDVHDILGGKSQIFKITGASGDVYQFRQFISGEKQAYRKSLKTRDLATALERAEKLTVQNYNFNDKKTQIVSSPNCGFPCDEYAGKKNDENICKNWDDGVLDPSTSLTYGGHVCNFN